MYTQMMVIQYSTCLMQFGTLDRSRNTHLLRRARSRRSYHLHTIPFRHFDLLFFLCSGLVSSTSAAKSRTVIRPTPIYIVLDHPISFQLAPKLSPSCISLFISFYFWLTTKCKILV
ncbi:hypothetical protein V8E53_002591 [Lactarius tabidus]